jgi:hypothetical protein
MIDRETTALVDSASTGASDGVKLRGGRMKTRVILTCGDEDTRQTYIEKMRSPEIQVDAVSSLSELYQRLLENRYSGILIDIKTKMRATGREKELIHNLLEVFPVVQLNLDRASGEIRSLFFGQSEGGGTIEDFLQKECSSFRPRSIRADSRKDVNLNVLLAETEEYLEPGAVRTVTLNISKGGCFIYSTREWALQTLVSFTIKEISDPKPITGEVRWQIPWGTSTRIPGIGVRFVHIGQDQQKTLCDTFRL